MQDSAAKAAEPAVEVLQPGRRAPIIPVIVLQRIEDAVPLARALVDGGIEVLEVTLRTPVGLAAIERIAAEVPGALVGAGTVLNVRDIAAVASAGARFAFSPGWFAPLSVAARDAGLALVPGVMTPGEAMAALDAGHRLLKLFPAREAGGPAMLRAMAGPLAELRFCPTGGVDAANLRDYLSLPNVFAVGGSWLTPAKAMAAQDWAAVTALARAAVAAARDVRSAGAAGALGAAGAAGAAPSPGDSP